MIIRALAARGTAWLGRAKVGRSFGAHGRSCEPRVHAYQNMPTVNQDALRRIATGSDSWTWPVGLIAVYAVPGLALWRDGTPDASVLVLSIGLAVALVALSEFDRRTFRLPDQITIPLALCGVLAAALMGNGVLWHLFSAALGLALILLVDWGYRAWRGFDGIGLGDAKLLAASGAWLGAQALPTVLLWACVSALGVLLLMHVSGRRVGARTAIPFGSFLAFGTWLAWCLGPLQ